MRLTARKQTILEQYDGAKECTLIFLQKGDMREIVNIEWWDHSDRLRGNPPIKVHERNSFIWLGTAENPGPPFKASRDSISIS